MNVQERLKNALNSGVNILKNLRHFRWTSDVIKKNGVDFDPFNEDNSKNSPDINDQLNFRIQALKLQDSLKKLQIIIKGIGYKPSIMYIGDLFEQKLADGKSNFIFGLMYPLNNVYGEGLAVNFQKDFPLFFYGQDDLESSIEALISEFGVAVVTGDRKEHLNDSTSYALQIFYIGSRPQFDVDRDENKQHIVVDEDILINIWSDLNSAYRNLDQGIIADLDNDDAAPTEA